MSTITNKFTKEQLIAQAQKNIEVLRGAVEKIPGSSDAAVIHLRLAEIALASLEAEPVVTDAMALAFHGALTDGSIGADDVEDIQTGLRAALANYAAPQLPQPVQVSVDFTLIRRALANAGISAPESDEELGSSHIRQILKFVAEQEA